MEIQYRKEDHRSWVYYEIEDGRQEEYQIQMCRRNTLSGLLPLRQFSEDGHRYLAWDITSRLDLMQLQNGPGLTTHQIRDLLTELFRVTDVLEEYLVSYELLSLSPELIYMHTAEEEFSFICDFREGHEFHQEFLHLAEILLTEADHSDPAIMELVYGLYRIAVPDVFDREALGQLLFGKKSRKESEPKKDRPENKSSIFNGEEPADNTPGVCKGSYPAGSRKGDGKEGRPCQRSRENVLEDFFSADDEDDLTGTEGIAVYPVLLLLGGAGMELVFFVRNGYHISTEQIVFGMGILLLCILVSLLSSVVQKQKARHPEGKMSSEAEIQAGKYKLQHAERDLLSETADPAEMTGSVCFSEAEEEQKEEGFEETVLLLPSSPESGPSAMLLPVKPQGDAIPLPEDGGIIGSLPAHADILLPARTVSRVHARIRKEGEKYYLMDLNSRNGTKKNGQELPCRQWQEIQDQDELCFADYTCLFCFPAQS